MQIQTPQFYTATGIARLADVNRCVVMRLLGQGLLPPDGYIEPLAGAGAPSPIFLASKALDVLKLQRVDHRRSPITSLVTSIAPSEIPAPVEPCSGRINPVDGNSADVSTRQ